MGAKAGSETATPGLKLISLRTNYMVNSWLHNLPSLKREHTLDNPLHINPEDMRALALNADDEVTVTSEHGQVVANVVADADLRAGVVAMTHGWGHGNNRHLTLASNHPGTNVNAVLPTVIDTPLNRRDMPDVDPAVWVAPADLANVICFLASDSARAVHGALVPVRGLS